VAQIFDTSEWASKVADDARHATASLAGSDQSQKQSSASGDAAANLSHDFQSLTPTQLRLVIGQMRINQAYLPMSVQNDARTGDVSLVEFHGAHDITVEAGTGKIFDKKREASQMVSEIDALLQNKPDSEKHIKEHFQKLNPAEMRLVADELLQNRDRWKTFAVNRSPDGDILALNFGDLAIDATNGKTFDPKVEAMFCLREMVNVLAKKKDTEASKLVLPYILGTMSKGELSLVTQSMQNYLYGYGFVEPTWDGANISALRFMYNTKQLTVDLKD
jgi:hypothetical protein